MKGRIVKGATVHQDHAICAWPGCVPPTSEWEGGEHQYFTKFPNAIFDVEWKGTHWDCKRKGYGVLGGENYGNGSIFVRKFEDVELVAVEDWELDKSIVIVERAIEASAKAGDDLRNRMAEEALRGVALQKHLAAFRAMEKTV